MGYYKKYQLPDGTWTTTYKYTKEDFEPDEDNKCELEEEREWFPMPKDMD